MPDLTFEKLVRILSSYSGRDKALRTIYFSLVLLSTRLKNSELAQRILALAKQLSQTRLVLRQLNHAPMVYVCRSIPDDLRHAPDKLDSALNSAVTLIYTVHAFVEASAWLADAKLLPLNAAKWFRWSLYLWLYALVAGITRFVRRIWRKGIDKTQDDQLTLVGLTSDFIAGHENGRNFFSDCFRCWTV
ncbi:Protein PRX-11 [Aphelenchoides avenae]|nr:Protein PRX-11 [Aphelenchus avenae]